MKHYRIYSLDSAGHIKFGYDCACPDDAAALAEGEKEAAKFNVEVWQGARLVGRLPKRAAPR